jgi:homoserine kinase
VKLVVHAPATVANVGPGFDCLGLALDLENEFTLETDVAPGIRIEGEGTGELASGRANLVLRAIERTFDAAGRAIPPFHLTCHNRIPLRRGLGSSSTAAVAGLMFAARLLDRSSAREDLLEDAVELEGHADNVAACLLGGVTVAYQEGGDHPVWRAVRVDPNPILRPVVLVPDEEETETASARSALPRDVAMSDAVFNLSRSALAVLALTVRPDLLRAALQDRLHQRQRLALALGAEALFDRLAADDFPVCVAGSGPSLLAFELDGRIVPEPGPGWRVLRPGLAMAGARLSAVV